MIKSMTGYGHGDYTQDGITATSEIRSVNSRYSEITIRLPKSISTHENEIKDLLKEKIDRGKINISISFNKEYESEAPLKINEIAALSYLKLLKDLKKTTKIKDPITLNHLINFSDIFEVSEESAKDTFAWSIALKSLNIALNELMIMRMNEGKFLQEDVEKRINSIENKILEIETISRNKIPEEREKLRSRVKQIIESNEIDESRLDLEITLLADKLDVTEECVRFKSHNIFFLNCINDQNQSGRKLNFLIQEMNREINTIGAKSNDTNISHLVVEVKEELEKIREQLQNIE